MENTRTDHQGVSSLRQQQPYLLCAPVFKIENKTKKDERINANSA
jgi:hypothetical protein